MLPVRGRGCTKERFRNNLARTGVLSQGSIFWEKLKNWASENQGLTNPETTNIFVYLFDETDDYKRERAERLVQQVLENETGCISYQVVQETLNVVIQKLNATPEKARQILDHALIPLWRVNPTRTLYQRGLELQTRYSLSFYDSLIVAAPLDAGCKTLYSEDLQHGLQIKGVTITNPFRT